MDCNPGNTIIIIEKKHNYTRIIKPYPDKCMQNSAYNIRYRNKFYKKYKYNSRNSIRGYKSRSESDEE
jgi:hypothetical protein